MCIRDRYIYGGIYFDLSIHFQESIPIERNKVTLFRDLFSATPYDCYNGLMYVPSKHQLLSLSIENCLKNIKSEYYGPNALCPTGPILFGRNVAIACEPEDLKAGEALSINKGQPHQAFIFSHPESNFGIVAARRKRTAGLAELGVTSGNIYWKIWKSRSVYGFDRIRKYDKSFFIKNNFVTTQCIQGEKIIVPSSHEGLILHGPYLYLEPGNYCVAVKLSITAVSQRLIFDACNLKSGIIHEEVYDALPNNTALCLFFNVTIHSLDHDYQFRLRGPVGKELQFEEMYIRKHQ